MRIGPRAADIIFFVFPSTTAKIFATFNCVSFDDDFDGSDSWMRADLAVDCNAPERSGWIAYAVTMILVYPVGVPAVYTYLLLYKFREPIEYQRDAEQLAASTKQAVRRVDKLQIKRSSRRASEQQGRRNTSLTRSCTTRMNGVMDAVAQLRASTTRERGLSARDSSASVQQESETSVKFAPEPSQSAGGGAAADAEASCEAAAAAGVRQASFTTQAVYAKTSSVLDKLKANYLGFLLNPYMLRVYWFEIFQCFRKIALVGLPVFFIDRALGDLSSLLLLLLRLPASSLPLLPPSLLLHLCSSLLTCSSPPLHLSRRSTS